ncbi:hypothetical protein [Marinospirillum insulare]|uniref:Uncharacterized protein n=1 Tax=Marinospirillum insulare TaxID=217169 RepID=A0ABQ6A0D4_9GAMM|nr:hypothetical protein [Marinospirillum insulare]GLR64381.1 hypothetical protein GCM10007878_18190 [Marinospirillum insulare]
MSFFKDKCLTLVSAEEFGVCDKNDSPAFVDFENKVDWIAVVKNTSALELSFYAIDKCIVYTKADGGVISSCDAAIKIPNNKVLFIELKERRYSGWISSGIEQLKSTLQLYKQYEANLASETLCYLSNSLRPKVPRSRVRETAALKQEFKLSTGSELKLEALITI